jgi:hypothetical protein
MLDQVDINKQVGQYSEQNLRDEAYDWFVNTFLIEDKTVLPQKTEHGIKEVLNKEALASEYKRVKAVKGKEFLITQYNLAKESRKYMMLEQRNEHGRAFPESHNEYVMFRLINKALLTKILTPLQQILGKPAGVGK